LDAAVMASDVVTENAPGVGGHGGSCKCPSGETFQVGDNYDYCGSLACDGGESDTCNSEDGPWSGRKVVCASTPEPFRFWTKVSPFEFENDLYCATSDAYYRKPEYTTVAECLNGCESDNACDAIAFPTGTLGTVGPSGTSATDYQCTFYSGCVLSSSTQSWGFHFWTAHPKPPSPPPAAPPGPSPPVATDSCLALPPTGVLSWSTVNGTNPPPQLYTNGVVQASSILWQTCKTTSGAVADAPFCPSVTLGWCREQCELYEGTSADQKCCNAESRRDARDFFRRKCRDPAPSEINKVRCQTCTGFAYDALARTCVLTSSDWGQSKFLPSDGLSDIPTSTFYVRERTMGHASGALGHTHEAAHLPSSAIYNAEERVKLLRKRGNVSHGSHRHNHSYVKCPFLSSGYRFLTRADVESPMSRFDQSTPPKPGAHVLDAMVYSSETVLSDLELCQPGAEAIDAAGHTPYQE